MAEKLQDAIDNMNMEFGEQLQEIENAFVEGLTNHDAKQKLITGIADNFAEIFKAKLPEIEEDYDISHVTDYGNID